MERIKKYARVFVNAVFCVVMAIICIVCAFAPFISACANESLAQLLWYILTIPIIVLCVYILNDIYDLYDKLC